MTNYEKRLKLLTIDELIQLDRYLNKKERGVHLFKMCPSFLFVIFARIYDKTLLIFIYLDKIQNN